MKKTKREAWRSAVEEAVDHRFEKIVALRRHMHAYPELSGQEQKTSLHLYQLLDKEDFLVQIGPEGRGVIADLPGEVESNSQRIALRADIDALPILDAKQVAYRSQVDGVMHACGHDAHSAIVYGALTAINDLREKNRLPFPVVLRAIFQPAEEICVGAREMIDVGALNGVDAILATHVDPSRPTGKIGLRRGVLTAACDEMHITIMGQGGHAARPHETIDPIAASAQLINSFYLNIPRATDSQDAVVVSIGKISGGQNANVIPEQVELRGTVRTLDAEVRLLTFDLIRQLASAVAQATGSRIEVEFGLGCQSVRNAPQLVDLLANQVIDLLDEGSIQWIQRSSMGSEDFAFYLDHVEGAMLRLGCVANDAPSHALHTCLFDIDERSLSIGAKILAAAVVEWSDPNRGKQGI